MRIDPIPRRRAPQRADVALEMHRAVSRFVHDLTNHLSAILCLSDELRRSSAHDAGDRSDLDAIRHAAEDALALTHALRKRIAELARPELPVRARPSGALTKPHAS